MWKQLRLFWFSRNLYLSIYCAWVKRALEKKNTVELWFYFYSLDIALLVVIFFMITCLLWLPSLASLLQNVLCTEVSSSHLSCFTAGFRVFHFFCFIHVLTSLFELNVSVKCSLPTLTSKAAAFLSQQSELSTNKHQKRFRSVKPGWLQVHFLVPASPYWSLSSRFPFSWFHFPSSPFCSIIPFPMHLPSLNRHQSSAGSRPLKKVCVLWDKVDELSAAAVSTMLTLTHGNVLMMRREQYLVCVLMCALGH